MDRLRQLTEADKFPVDDEVLSMISDSADGGMRDAESILDQLLSFGDGKLQVDDVSKLLGMGSYHLLDQVVESILQSDSAESLKALNSLADQGADLSQCLKKFVSHFRDLMVFKINPDLIDASETRLQQLAKQSGEASIDRLTKIARILTQTESDIKQLGYERLNLELALVKLSRIGDNTVPLEKVLDKLEEIESRLSTAGARFEPVVGESDSSYDVAAASVVDVQAEKDDLEENEESDPLRSMWSKLLKAVKAKKLPALHAVLKEASPLSVDDDCLIIDFDPKFNYHREQVAETSNKKVIEAEFSGLMGKPMNLEIRAAESSQGEGDNSQTFIASEKDLRSEAMGDEKVKLVLDAFDGRVVEVKQ